MSIQQKIKLGMLDTSTLLLISFFLTIPNQKLSFLFIFFMISMNVSTSTILIISQKKEMFVYFVVGKSKKKIILSYLKNNIIFTTVSVCLILMTLSLFKLQYSYHLLFLCIICILNFLKTAITYLTVRRLL